MAHTQYQPGDWVRDNYGAEWCVRQQDGLRVYVWGFGGWIHPTNLRRI